MTKSAAFFAVRVLTDPEAPPSAGAHRPVQVIAPRARCSTRRSPAAVAAGNVETSSRVADLVLAALAGARPGPAQGQGTMNNLTLAGEGWTYYETIGGGQGACPDADGPSAIHVAMSNTLNTPVEALESEYPVRVRELAVRRGSGGDGRHRGGDGIVRELEALEPMRFTLITERRAPCPARARRRRATARRGATCSTATNCRRSARASCAPATGCGSKRRAAAATEAAERRSAMQHRITNLAFLTPSLDSGPSTGPLRPSGALFPARTTRSRTLPQNQSINAYCL